jgi:hypothetical protein
LRHEKLKELSRFIPRTAEYGPKEKESDCPKWEYNGLNYIQWDIGSRSDVIKQPLINKSSGLRGYASLTHLHKGKIDRTTTTSNIKTSRFERLPRIGKMASVEIYY